MSGAAGPRAAARQFAVDSDDDDIRIDRWFQRHLPDIGFAQVSRWARTGQLRLDGKRVAPGDRVLAGQTIRIPPAEPQPAARPARAARPLSAEQIALAEGMVIHRDRAAIVLNKPPGLATQGGTKTHAHVDGLTEALIFDAASRPRLVHRLDKDTSGVLLLARSPGSAAFFAKRFAGRSARKIYWALVVGVPEIAAGEIDLAIAKQPGSGGEKMHVDTEGGQPARTRYRVIERAGSRCAWLALQPLTGRTHQLRVHLAAIGHPIVGDGKYGGQQAFLTGSISRKMHLHARRLRIEHPDGAPLDITAEPPEHFAESLAQLGFDPALGDIEPSGEAGPAPGSAERKQAQKQKARAHAKQLRRARRGERRGRGESAPAKSAKPRPSAKPHKPAKPATSAKPGSAPKSAAKPGPKSASKSTTPGRPARPRPQRRS